MIAPVEALARMPESLDAAEAAPLMCAGITTFNALRHSGAFPGDLVTVQGVGGLGHLGIQFAKKSGYRVAAVGRGTENAAIAKKLGADVYIDSAATDAAAELQKLGGARVVLASTERKVYVSACGRTGSEWHFRGHRRRAGSNRGVNHAVDSRQADHQGMVCGNAYRLGRYLAVR
jgi:D-arabinose 1-dehydrogenase-like Zn-dependent alcohol dehydrogenase